MAAFMHWLSCNYCGCPGVKCIIFSTFSARSSATPIGEIITILSSTILLYSNSHRRLNRIRMIERSSSQNY